MSLTATRTETAKDSPVTLHTATSASKSGEAFYFTAEIFFNSDVKTACVDMQGKLRNVTT